MRSGDMELACHECPAEGVSAPWASAHSQFHQKETFRVTEKKLTNEWTNQRYCDTEVSAMAIEASSWVSKPT